MFGKNLRNDSGIDGIRRRDETRVPVVGAFAYFGNQLTDIEMGGLCLSRHTDRRRCDLDLSGWVFICLC